MIMDARQRLLYIKTYLGCYQDEYLTDNAPDAVISELIEVVTNAIVEGRPRTQ